MTKPKIETEELLEEVQQPDDVVATPMSPFSPYAQDPIPHTFIQ